MAGILEGQNFTIELGERFAVESDEVGYQCLCQEPPAILTLLPETVENKDELPNLSRMLAGFLTRSGHPVATDELLRMTNVPGAHGFSWQYVENENYHRLWLFGNEASWLLMTFICPLEHRDAFHEFQQTMVKSLRLKI